MAGRGAGIIVSGDPQGKFLEGIIDGTPKPGTAMTVKAATEPVGGSFTWEPFAPADGAHVVTAILLPDHMQGKLYSDAYVDADRCFLYCPAMGELLNILLENISGTADSFAIGDLVSPNSGTGKFIANSSHAKPAFTVMQTKSALTADDWCLGMYNG
ncbi:MAG TPA: hypothetical protein VD932_02545 [Aquabacterium sp.]|nr:hypothetical protein [Aquabacterium sp.]